MASSGIKDAAERCLITARALESEPAVRIRHPFNPNSEVYLKRLGRPTGLKPLSLWGFALLISPMIVDGGSHALSDLAGMGRGFRDGNAWLAALTGHVFPAWFYAGDTLGSFNSWMRLITGILFGVACVWLAYPYLEQVVSEMADVKWRGVVESPLLGPAGNKEFLVLIEKHG